MLREGSTVAVDRIRLLARRLRAADREAEATGAAIDDVVARLEQHSAERLELSRQNSAQLEGQRREIAAMLHAGMDRRDFLRCSALFGVSAAGVVAELRATAPPANAVTAPRVIVVGAGFAGIPMHSLTVSSNSTRAASHRR